MAKLTPRPVLDLERIIEFDPVRAMEQAALHPAQWMGRGDDRTVASAVGFTAVHDPSSKTIRLRSTRAE